MMSDALRILVLCTRNSARSQMAEALFATAGAGRITAASAGSDPGPGVHPLAVEALAELGAVGRRDHGLRRRTRRVSVPADGCTDGALGPRGSRRRQR
ncbi:MAG: hypothetical protein IT355_15795 [Gemmatimonadaceae bacterium]|nr:hypothetical protein [Gemmatimonadaceae bacterium]